MPDVILCKPKSLPEHRQLGAAARAVRENGANRPLLERLSLVMTGFAPTKLAIAVVTTKFWRGGGVDLTVKFLDNPEAALRKRILLHMNAWSDFANVRFRETSGDAQVRVAREADGYWSYVGTDILDQELTDKQTMNLEAFTMSTPESEFVRVVRHETGHTLGCPHEHMRRQLVNRVDRAKAYKYFLATQGWDRNTVDQQVLTALEDSSIMGTTSADETSIMCYQLPAEIMKDGKPIIGGKDIDQVDRAFMATIYPPKPRAKRSAKTMAQEKAKGAVRKVAGRSTSKTDTPRGRR